MKSKASFSWDLYHKTPIVGIIRGLSLDTIIKIAEAYQSAGFHTLEVTMNTNAVTDIIKALRSEFSSLNIGAGTVCTSKDLENALEAGAQFIVTPVIVEEVIKGAVENKTPIFPGAFTPSEIYKAWSLGATAVKVFPATQLGVQYMKDVSAPLDEIKLVPTGGVSIENIKAFFEAGVYGVGMGNSLFNKDLVTEKKFDALQVHFEKVKAEIKDFIK